MEFKALVKQIPFSPYKLRPYVEGVRGRDVTYALRLLMTQAVMRVVPIRKVIQSAAANAMNREGIAITELRIKEIRVDQGKIFKYFKPGSMGRAAAQRKRFSHISVVLELKNQPSKEA